MVRVSTANCPLVMQPVPMTSPSPSTMTSMPVRSPVLEPPLFQLRVPGLFSAMLGGARQESPGTATVALKLPLVSRGLAETQLE